MYVTISCDYVFQDFVYFIQFASIQLLAASVCFNKFDFDFDFDFDHFVIAICRSSHVSCGETADWIGMPFGVVSGRGVRLGIGVLDFSGDRRRARGSLG